MSYYVRMINYSKWSNSHKKLKEIDNVYSETPADVITTELRTQNNTISLWKIDDLNELDEIVLSLALSRNKLDRLDVMIIEQKKLETFIDSNDIKNDPKTANTPIKQLQNKHYDIVNMTYSKLGKLSNCMMEVWEDSISCNPSQLIRKTVPDIKNIYNKIDTTKIDKNLIPNKIYLELEKSITDKIFSLNSFINSPIKSKEFKKIIQESVSLKLIITRLEQGVYSSGNRQDDEKIKYILNEYADLKQEY